MSSMQQAFVVTGTGGDTRRVPVGASIVVGRGGTCDLVIRDLAASRQHLKIVKVAADSKGISFVLAGGARIKLAPGDVWFGAWSGEVWLTIYCSADPAQKPAAEPALKE